MVQLITEPTRVTCHSLTILASVITNCPGHSSTSETLSPPSNCDHSVIFANMNIFAYRSRSYKRQVWNFNNVDTTNVNGELSELDWISLSARLQDELACEPLSIRRERHKLSQFYKIVQNLTRRYLTELLLKISSERTHFRFRSRENFTQLRCRTSTFQVFFSITNHLLEFSGLRCPKLCISSLF